MNEDNSGIDKKLMDIITKYVIKSGFNISKMKVKMKAKSKTASGSCLDVIPKYCEVGGIYSEKVSFILMNDSVREDCVNVCQMGGEINKIKKEDGRRSIKAGTRNKGETIERALERLSAGAYDVKLVVFYDYHMNKYTVTVYELPIGTSSFGELIKKLKKEKLVQESIASPNNKSLKGTEK